MTWSQYKIYAVNGFDGTDFDQKTVFAVAARRGAKRLAEDIALVARHRRDTPFRSCSSAGRCTSESPARTRT